MSERERRRERRPCCECRRPGRLVEVAGSRLVLCADHELDAIRALRAAAETMVDSGRGSGIPNVVQRRVKR